MRQKNEKKFFKNWQAKVLSLLFAVFLYLMFCIFRSGEESGGFSS